MSFPPPRLARAQAPILSVLPLLATLLVIAGCSGHRTVPPNPTQTVTWRAAAPTGSPTVSPTGTPSASPTPTTTAVVSAALAPYVACIPTFDPAPTPGKVALPHVEGRAAFVHEVPTTQKVAFLTIDDGINRHPLALELLAVAKVPVTLFLTTNYISSNVDYFRALRDTGYATIEGHTVSHPHLPQLGYGDQKYQLCSSTDKLEQWFGTRPTFFRPPYGERNDDTLRAAWSCGLRFGFHWRETVDAGNVYYQRPDATVHPGDIILMHFRPAFPEDFIAALAAIKAAGLVPALLADYVDLAPATPYVPPPAQDPTAPPGA